MKEIPRCGMYKKNNKELYQKRPCIENKALQLMVYYELKLHWMKVCWLYERSLKTKFAFVFLKKVF